MRRHATVVLRWPLCGPGPPDLAVVQELARLRLAARRLGGDLELRDACPELSELLDLVGLREVCGQPEEREQPGVEEVVVPDDPVA